MDAIIKTLLAQITQRGNRERDRREEWERSLKPTQYKGNNLFQEMGGNPIAGRYLGQSGLIPGQFVPNIGRNPNKPVIPGLPIPVETEEEPVFIPSIPYLVHLEQIDDTGFRAIYYRGSQKITLGDFRVFSNGLNNIRDYYVAWIYDNEVNHKWKQWVVWIRVTEVAPVAPGGYPVARREVNFGVKGSSTTVIESRIYGKNTYVYYDQENDYSFATHNNPLSYALYDSLSYGTTVITPKDFLDTYDSDDPANYLRLDRLRWEYYPYHDFSVRFIDENTIEVKSESTGRWIPFSNFNRTGNIIGGTTR